MNEGWKGHPEAYPADPEPEPEGPEPPKEPQEMPEGWMSTVELLNTLDAKLSAVYLIGKELRQAEQDLEAIRTRHNGAIMAANHFRILVNNRLGR